jgi:hypothetical protein
MFGLSRLLLIWGFLVLSEAVFAQCNGFTELCTKRYNEVAYLTTHNAFNAEEDNFQLPNHTYGLTRQLEDGVRGLMIDVYDEGGVATVYHSFSFLGTATLESNLTEIKDFLDANPTEIVTIIFECYADFVLVETAFINTGMLDYTLEQDLNDDWPTLQQMIDDNKRLVVLSDRDDAAPGENWYHYVWDYAVETPFSNNSNADFTCEFNRGDENNDLFILNHFATDPNLGVGRQDLSELANEYDFFYNRAMECWNELGKFPNFPTIDFHELGEPFRVVDSLNLNYVPTGIQEKSIENAISVYPNPGNAIYTLDFEQSTEAMLRVYSTSGSLILETNVSGGSVQLDLTEFDSGLYHILVESNGGLLPAKLIHLR